MVGAVVARSSVRREVCDRATAELQERASPHACLLPWIPMRTTFNFPSLVSSVHDRSADATSHAPLRIRPAKVRQAEVRPGEVRRAEIRHGEGCPPEVRPAEVRPSEFRHSEGRRDEVRQAEDRPAEVRATEVRPEEVSLAEIRPGETRPAEIFLLRSDRLRSGRTEGSFALQAFQTSTPCRMSARCSGSATSFGPQLMT